MVPGAWEVPACIVVASDIEVWLRVQQVMTHISPKLVCYSSSNSSTTVCMSSVQVIWERRLSV
jgi:hypothetical protein